MKISIHKGSEIVGGTGYAIFGISGIDPILEIYSAEILYHHARGVLARYDDSKVRGIVNFFGIIYFDEEYCLFSEETLIHADCLIVID